MRMSTRQKHSISHETPSKFVGEAKSTAEADEARTGMAWWNALSEDDRRYWCFAGMTATPAEAWRYYKRVTFDAEKRTVVIEI
jgi:hypothetical protein